MLGREEIEEGAARETCAAHAADRELPASVEVPLIDVPLVEEQGPEHHLFRREAALQVQAILQALSPEDRRLLAAIFLREVQVKDYAAKYDIELHTAYRERDRALERARALAARVLRVFGRKAR